MKPGGAESTRGAANQNPNKSNLTRNEDKKHKDSKLGEVEDDLEEQRQKRELEEKKNGQMEDKEEQTSKSKRRRVKNTEK